MRHKNSVVVLKRPRGRPRKKPAVPPSPAPGARETDPANYTIEEFCALFACTRKAWPTHRPYLKTIQFGPRTLIPRDEVRRYIDSLERPAEKGGVPPRLKAPAGREHRQSR
jgi:hypothetical protein